MNLSQRRRARTSALGAVLALGALASAQGTLTPLEALGKELFFDAGLSQPLGQSCATCHDPTTGFTSPSPEINAHGAVFPGAAPRRFGNRKPPTAGYAGFSPVLHHDAADDVWIGGVFWNGRASGWRLGDPLAEQALAPFLNPLEQNVSNKTAVVQKVTQAPYAALFEEVWGPGALDWMSDAQLAYERIGRSLAAYERSPELNPFTSKYDAWLQGLAALTPQEELGRRLFVGRALCSACHPAAPGPNGEPPLFTDFTYDNLGVPRNPENPFYRMGPSYNPAGQQWVDRGLGGFLEFAGYPPAVYGPELGKHRVPTLRNVDRRPEAGFVKAFGHNGYFKSLADVVHFYNTRDLPGAGWPPAEVAETVNTDELGDLGLDAGEEAALVAFLRTLSDGYLP